MLPILNLIIVKSDIIRKILVKVSHNQQWIIPSDKYVVSIITVGY